jgi:hypothetical protein
MTKSRNKESKDAMEPREIKGLEIAAKLKLVPVAIQQAGKVHRRSDG